MSLSKSVTWYDKKWEKGCYTTSDKWQLAIASWGSFTSGFLPRHWGAWNRLISPWRGLVFLDTGLYGTFSLLPRFTLAMASWLAMASLWHANGFTKLVLYVTHSLQARCELAMASELTSSSLWQGLVLHEMSEFPKKKHWPDMECLVSTHAAQSTSLKPCRWKE